MVLSVLSTANRQLTKFLRTGMCRMCRREQLFCRTFFGLHVLFSTKHRGGLGSSTVRHGNRSRRKYLKTCADRPSHTRREGGLCDSEHSWRVCCFVQRVVASPNTFVVTWPEQEPVQEQAPCESKKRKAAVGGVDGAASAGATDNSGFWCPPFKVRFGYVSCYFLGVRVFVFW